MKKIWGLIALFGTSAAFAAPVVTYQPKLITLKPTEIFAPVSFDNNDQAEIVVAGEYPDTCYRSGPVEVSVDHAKKTVQINSQAYYYDQFACLYTLVPYSRTIELGILNDGSYSVFFRKHTGQLEKVTDLSVAVSQNAGPDDYLYAPITDAFVQTDASGKKLLTLKGKFTSSCMSLKEVKMNVTQTKVIEVLPIIETSGTQCQPVDVDFEHDEYLPTVQAGNYLVHVRSLNGRAINKVEKL